MLPARLLSPALPFGDKFRVETGKFCNFQRLHVRHLGARMQPAYQQGVGGRDG